MLIFRMEEMSIKMINKNTVKSISSLYERAMDCGDVELFEITEIMVELYLLVHWPHWIPSQHEAREQFGWDKWRVGEVKSKNIKTKA